MRSSRLKPRSRTSRCRTPATSRALNRERKVGLNQYYGITSAQHALTDAQYAEITAQKQLIIIQKEAANSQIVAAHQIADAVFALKQAYFAQSQAAITSARQQSDAQFALAQAAYQSAFGTQEAASAWQQYAEAVATGINAPAAARAIELLKPVVKWWNDLAVVQEKFWSQVDKALPQTTQQWMGLLRPVQHLLGDAASSLGKVLADALGWLERFIKSPAFSQILDPANAKILYNLGEAALIFGQALAQIAIAAAPFATWLSGKIADFARDFLQWADAASKAGSPFLIFLNAAKTILPQIAGVLEAVIHGFAILAGVGGSGQKQNLADFSLLLTALSEKVLPNLFHALQALASPQLFQALVALLVALSKLLLIMAESGGIQLFLALLAKLVMAFAVLAGWLSRLHALTYLLVGVLGLLAAAWAIDKVLAIAAAYGKVEKAVLGAVAALRKLFGATTEATAAEGAAATAAAGDATAQGALGTAEGGAAGAASADAAAQGALGGAEGAGAAGGALRTTGAAAGAAGGAEGAAGGILGGIAAGGAAGAAGVTAFAASVAVLGYWLATYKPAQSDFAKALTEGGIAAQYSGQKYRDLAKALQLAHDATQPGNTTAQTRALAAQAHQLGLTAYQVSYYGAGMGDVAARQAAAVASGQRLSTAMTEIQRTFHLTAGQAAELAHAAGVSAAQLAASGQAGYDATSKVLAYGSAASTAGGETNAMALQVQGVVGELNILSGTVLQAQSDALSWKIAQQNATASIQQNGGALTGNTLAAEQNRQTLIQLTQQAIQLAIQQATTGNSIGKATGTLKDQITYLQNAQGDTHVFAQEIKALRDEEAKLKDIKATVGVTGHGDWTINGIPVMTETGPGQGIIHIQAAEGGYLGREYGGSAGVDSIHAMLMPEEYVHRASAVRQYGVDAMDAINDGTAAVMFGAGGPAAGRAGTVKLQMQGTDPRSLAGFISKAYAGTVTGFAQAAALGSLVNVTGAGAAGGGYGNLPGGGTPAANMRLGQIMANAYGWAGGLEWGNLAALWNRESGWSNLAYNRNGGATGIPQSLPYSKMPKPAWLPFQGGQASAEAQIGWGLAYIHDRWRDPVGAYSGAGSGSVTGAAYNARGDWYAAGGLADASGRRVHGGGSGGSGSGGAHGAAGAWEVARERLHGSQRAMAAAAEAFLTAKHGAGWEASKGTGLQTGKTVGIPKGLISARKKIAALLGIEIRDWGTVDSDAGSGAAVFRPDEAALASALVHLGGAIGPDARKYLPDHATALAGSVGHERHALENAVSTWHGAMLPDSDLDDAQKWNRYAAYAMQAGAAEERAAKPLDTLNFSHLAKKNPKLAKALTKIRDLLRKAQAAFASALGRVDFRRAPSQIPPGAWDALETAERHIRRITGAGGGAGDGGGGIAGGGGSGPGAQVRRHHRPGGGGGAGGGGGPVGGGGPGGSGSAGYEALRDYAPDKAAALAGAMASFSGFEHRAHKVWRHMQAARHDGPPTPGIGSGIPVSNAGTPVDVWSLVSGGPSAGSYGSLPGFARGGMVPARMASFARPMASGGLAGRVPPARTLSAAAAASGAHGGHGAAGGIAIGTMNIHNPVAEKAGESVTRAVQRSAFLAGRGVA